MNELLNPPIQVKVTTFDPEMTISNYDLIMSIGGYPLLFAILIGAMFAIPILNSISLWILRNTTEESDLWNIAEFVWFMTNPVIIYRVLIKKENIGD